MLTDLPRTTYRGKSRVNLRLLSLSQLEAALEACGNSKYRLALWAGRDTKTTSALVHAAGLDRKSDAKTKTLHRVPGPVLARLAVECAFNQCDVADRLGVAADTLRREYRRRGLKGRHGRRVFPLSRDLLYRWYVTHGLSTAAISRKLGYKAKDGVWRWLRRFGIPLRPPGDIRVAGAESYFQPRPFTLPDDWHLSVEELARREADRAMSGVKARKGIA